MSRDDEVSTTDVTLSGRSMLRPHTGRAPSDRELQGPIEGRLARARLAALQQEATLKRSAYAVTVLTLFGGLIPAAICLTLYFVYDKAPCSRPIGQWLLVRLHRPPRRQPTPADSAIVWQNVSACRAVSLQVYGAVTGSLTVTNFVAMPRVQVGQQSPPPYTRHSRGSSRTPPHCPSRT